MTMNTVKSPLRYPGGKSRACKKLDEIFTKHFAANEFENVISPFAGGMSFELYLNTKYGFPIHANDKFAPLYNFWDQAKNNNMQLCAELEKYLGAINKDTFTQFRAEIMNNEPCELNKAVQYFIINRCSFSGATLSGGFSQEASTRRFTQSSIDRLRKIDLTDFDFTCEDFGIIIDAAGYDDDAKKTFLFLDPPYYLNSGKLYGMKGDLHDGFDHARLRKKIGETTSKWMMTYNDCEYIRELYKDFTILDVSWSYGMNQSKKSSEIVILHT